MSSLPVIIFVDNTINRIFKSIDLIRETFPGLQIFSTENEFTAAIDLGLEPDVILFNLDLFPNDAIHIMKEIRQRTFPSQPFIVIYTDKGDDFIQELAFNAGADAFINFHAKGSLLKLFLRNLLRRRKVPVGKETKQLTIDYDRYLVYKNGQAVQLPRKEFRLFEMLYKGSDRFFTKLEIAAQIWQDERIASKRTIDVHIYNIRRFFGKRIIQSQKGKGYRINKNFIR
jgi:DNA-binding response OmpR family regulator